MSAGGPLARTPFYFLDRRPYHEAELAAYLRREHRRGRHLSEIVNDRYVERCGGESVIRVLLRRPSVVKALGEDVVQTIVHTRTEEYR
jgi:hypothetical protein